MQWPETAVFKTTGAIKISYKIPNDVVIGAQDGKLYCFG